MNLEELREYCLSVKGATESFPFDDSILVFKVMEKMFAFLSIEPKDGVFRVSLKCDVEKAIDLRERYEGIGQGFYTSSPMWISVAIESDVENNLIKDLISHSVDEVIKKLSKKKQEEYKQVRK